MADLLNTIHTMPLAGLVPVFMLTVAGLVLWLAGRRVLRGAFVLVGLLAGAVAGAVTDASVESGLPGWTFPVIGGVTLALVAALTYRLGAAVMMALVLGIACPLSVIAVNDLQSSRGGGIAAEGDALVDVNDSISSAIERHQADLDEARSRLDDLKARTAGTINELAHKHGLQEEAAAGMAQAKSLGRAMIDALSEQWQRTPKRLRPLLSLSSIVGALTGLIIGLLARRFSDCAVTAMVGAAVWTAGARVIAERCGAPEGWWMPTGMLAWMGLWFILAVIGLSFQWARRSKPADKKP